MARGLPPIFDGMNEELIDEALQYFKSTEVELGTVLIQEGDEDTTIICVVNGEVEIKTGDVVLGHSGKGDIVGEMALFAGGGVRTATVEANSHCSLLLLDRIGYDALVYLGNPVARSIEERVLTLLSERLRKIGGDIAELAEGTPAEHVQPSPGFFEAVSAMFGGGGGRLRAPTIDRTKALTSSRFFDGYPEDGLEELSELFEVQAYKTGHFICTEGEPGSEMFLLVEGLVDVVVDTGEGRVEHIATLEAGEAFGVGSLIEPGLNRMASCIARSKAVVLQLDQLTWAESVHRPDQVGSILRGAIIRSLSDQLAYANAQIAMIGIREGTATTQEIDNLGPLLRAGAGMEANGQFVDGHVDDDDKPSYLA